jgi:hypothetical protein
MCRELFNSRMQSIEAFEEQVRGKASSVPTKSLLGDVDPEINIRTIKEKTVWLFREKRRLEKTLATGLAQDANRFTVPSRVVDTEAIRNQIRSIDVLIWRGMEFYLLLFSTFAGLDPSLAAALKAVPQLGFKPVSSVAEWPGIRQETFTPFSLHLYDRVRAYVDSGPTTEAEDATFQTALTVAEKHLVEYSHRMFGTFKSFVAEQKEKQKNELEDALTPLREMLLSRMEDPFASNRKEKENEGNTTPEEIRRQP